VRPLASPPRSREVRTLATKPRGWTGARTPSALKRVRSAARREAINQPRRSEAKTLVAKSVRVATGIQPGDADQALDEALSALYKSAKRGAIHPNAAARRKSRLARKVNDARGGAHVQAAGKAKSPGTTAAAKAARARIAASKAAKAKGAQTAAGKARAALSKTARTEAAEAAKGATSESATARTRTATTRTTKSTAPKATAKTTATRSTRKSTPKE